MTSVDGLVTGLDTTSIISQLMSLEAAPQTRLKSKVSDQQKLTTAYQAINTRMLAVQNAAKDLAASTTWTAVKATSSSSAVSVAASTTALAGTATFDVTSLAATHVLTSAVPGSGTPAAGASLDLVFSGKTVNVPVATNTPQGVADAINGANAGVRATVLTTTTGQVLQFSATGTGAAKSFSVSGLTNATAVMTQGADGVVTVGNPLAGGYKLASADNTFTGLIPGVTVTANKVESGITVSTTADPGKAADATQTLVNAVNSALSLIDGYTAYNATTKTGGVLSGNPMVRSLREQLLTTVSSGVPNGTFSTSGVSLDRTGALKFDRTAFLAAAGKDPAAVKAQIGTTLTGRYTEVADGVINSTTGKLTLVIQNGDAYVRKLNDQITDWDSKLASKKVALQRQYTNLETALGKLKDQSSWLSSQLSSLS
ncbi:flagellar filament capping protein FliD [Actinokineospora globicatena]|uniref:flagellar filament capping protein FliD n=1 Tax=Actinokineospora globicatena TaxID=103729 RepID=UPI0020A5ED04|nr:flagellar filament capping protein FliD [Actinokineospora globicatena]MCP2306233.1 flagellar hook-associated protein 2 [Actinokineospora globicatena]GLW81659.1 flagellar hook-associated protein 2 [Actinokineospora globicatena]GLW88453.1 flagellar hook-associated protein 2 [Actinokineospora globicatena]